MGCQPQKFVLLHPAAYNPADLKTPLGESSGFIHNHSSGTCKLFEEHSPLYQNSVTAAAPDGGKESKRDPDYQCTRAADYQKCQSTVKPLKPVSRTGKYLKIQRRQQSNRQGAVADKRCVAAGKAGYKFF